MSTKAIHQAELAGRSARLLPSLATRGRPDRSRRAAAGAGDVLLAMGVLFCIPFVILAIGMPIALVVELLLRMAR
ncbi:MAG TPA: hypothetical protein VD833_01295 [Vicinamibacterales bacterium]|nr:hypothetical protein [Vicinamibacterales bacterium]